MLLCIIKRPYEKVEGKKCNKKRNLSLSHKNLREMHTLFHMDDVLYKDERHIMCGAILINEYKAKNVV